MCPQIYMEGKHFECSYCEVFSSKSNLIAHQETYAEERPYKCDGFEKDFSSKSYFIEHQQNLTGEELCECSECGKTFWNNSQFAIYQRIHSSENHLNAVNFEKSSVGKTRLFHTRELFQHRNLMVVMTVGTLWFALTAHYTPKNSYGRETL